MEGTTTRNSHNSIFFFLRYFQKNVKSSYAKLFSIEKALLQLYCKTNLYVIPKFLLETVSSFQVCINALIKYLLSKHFDVGSTLVLG